jgi:signal transduction histidine kinase
MASAHYILAHCYNSLGDADLAMEQALGAVSIAEKLGYTSILAESFRILAIKYRDQEEIGKAELFISKAEELSKRIKDWDLLSRVYNLAGVIQFSQNKYDTALALYNKSILIAEEYATSKFHFPQVLSNIGDVYGKQANGERLEFLYFNKALSLAQEIGHKSAEAVALNDLGKICIKQNKYPEAEKKLLKSLELSKLLNLRRALRNVYLTLFELKTLQGRHLEAQQYMRMHYELKDSLQNERKTRQIIELEIRYENEKKQQDIKLLKQEKRVQIIWKNFYLVGSILLLLAITFIYRIQQLRNRKAKQLLGIQKKLNEKLKETDELKSRFFANISHEFRTPLTLILAPIEDKLKSSTLPISDKNDLLIVKRNANRLLDLVNQLLDLSKLEANKMELHLKEGNLDEFMRIFAASFNSMTEHKKIVFTKNIAVPMHPVLFDADKLEKIVNNILFNAFKFTPDGGSVTLSIYTSSDENELHINITDTGIGISEEDQLHIFSPFYQSKHTFDDGRQLGTGLGLSFVKELVKLYEGQIKLHSQTNNGTTISITLPIRQVGKATGDLAIGLTGLSN